MKTLEFENNGEEFTLEKCKDGSAYMTIEYAASPYDSPEGPAFITSSFTLSKEQVDMVIEFLRNSEGN